MPKVNKYSDVVHKNHNSFPVIFKESKSYLSPNEVNIAFKILFTPSKDMSFYKPSNDMLNVKIINIPKSLYQMSILIVLMTKLICYHKLNIKLSGFKYQKWVNSSDLRKTSFDKELISFAINLTSDYHPDSNEKIWNSTTFCKERYKGIKRLKKSTFIKDLWNHTNFFWYRYFLISKTYNIQDLEQLSNNLFDDLQALSKLAVQHLDGDDYSYIIPSLRSFSDEFTKNRKHNLKLMSTIVRQELLALNSKHTIFYRGTQFENIPPLLRKCDLRSARNQYPYSISFSNYLFSGFLFDNGHDGIAPLLYMQKYLSKLQKKSVLGQVYEHIFLNHNYHMNQLFFNPELNPFISLFVSGEMAHIRTKIPKELYKKNFIEQNSELEYESDSDISSSDDEDDYGIKGVEKSPYKYTVGFNPMSANRYKMAKRYEDSLLVSTLNESEYNKIFNYFFKFQSNTLTFRDVINYKPSLESLARNVNTSCEQVVGIKLPTEVISILMEFFA